MLQPQRLSLLRCQCSHILWKHCRVCAAEVQRGKGRVPVADYSLTAQALPDYADISPQTAMHAAATHSPTSSSPQPRTGKGKQREDSDSRHRPHSSGEISDDSSSAITDARLRHGADASSSSSNPVPSDSPSNSSSLDAQQQDRQQSGTTASSAEADGSMQDRHRGRKEDAREGRGVYSFCMCPGGQIVPTTTNPEELCINGMSFRCELGPHGVHAYMFLHLATVQIVWHS